MSTYVLSCTVCNGEYFSKSEWLHHLTSDNHQKLARKECIEMWNKKIRECCLVVFSSFPLSLESHKRSGGNSHSEGAEKIIEYFSWEPNTFVTDFVWWRERAFVGIAQFESRAKVKNLLSILGGNPADVQIDNQRVQVKWASGLLDLEWNAIWPVTAAASLNVNLEFENSSSHQGVDGANASTTTSLLKDPVIAEGNQNPEISSTEQRPEEERKTAIDYLRQFAEQRQWEMPEFGFFATTEINLPKYLCSVLLNGVEYKPSASIAGANTKYNAKLKAAQFCLDSVMTNADFADADAVDDDNDNTNANHLSDDNEVVYLKQVRRKEPCLVDLSEDEASACTRKVLNAVSRLKNYAKLCHWPPPFFTCSLENHNSDKKYKCSIFLNGVDYKPQQQNISVAAATEWQAKKIMAELVLRQVDLGEKPITDGSNSFNKNVSLYDYIPSWITPSLYSLEYQFWRIRKFMSIPQRKYNQAVKVTESLKALFSRNKLNVEVVMYRNWYLKLKSPWKGPENNELLIYIYYSQLPTQNTSTRISDTVAKKIFNLPETAKSFTILESPDDANKVNKNTVGWKLKYEPSQLEFRVVFLRGLIVEAQMCQMVEYLLKFDSRGYSLLALVHFWAFLNRVRVGEPDPNPLAAYKSLPDPATLQWLVIFFLGCKGIIPTPGEILERPHQILKERLTLVDIGFNDDPKFVQEWILTKKSKSHFNGNNAGKYDDWSNSLDVLMLFLEFTRFCGNTLTEKGNCMLNTRHGELIQISELLKMKGDTDGDNKRKRSKSSSLKTKMTWEQQQTLRSLLKSTEDSKKPDGDIVNKLHMINPFCFNRTFSISKDIQLVLNDIKKCGLRLEAFLNMREMNGVLEAKRQFGALENVLLTQVDKKKKQQD